jgi:hypothetical protein
MRIIFTSPYHKENTTLLHYTDHLVNVFLRIFVPVHSEDHMKPIVQTAELLIVKSRGIYSYGEPGSSGGTVSGYGLDDRVIEGRPLQKRKDFSSSFCVQTGSGAHPASCPIGTGGHFPRGKARFS